MFKLDDLKKEIKKDNSHYERFTKSSLHNLVELLSRKFPAPTALQVSQEMSKISAVKWTKYAHTRQYLLTKFSGLSALLSTAPVTVGVTTGGYTPGKFVRAKDADGGWHNYVLQAKGNSCGPACVLIVKTAWYPMAENKLSETEVRGVMALLEAGQENTGLSSLSPEAIGLHAWQNVGSVRDVVLKALQRNPYAVKNARAVTNLPDAQMLDELRNCTPKKPGIIGINWTGGGGHWVVCIGPTKANDRLIILDPWEGVQYLTNDVATYKDYMGAGEIDLSDPTMTS
jgi:hypothetical protein